MLSWLKVQAHVFFPEFPSAKGLRMDAECCQQRVRNGPQSFFLGRSVGPGVGQAASNKRLAQPKLSEPI